MWNYRREILLELFKQLEDAKQVQLLKRELDFTQQVGTRYPKSYWCWNQREWTTLQLERLSSVNWAQELAICSKFLGYDARNCEIFFSICY